MSIGKNIHNRRKELGLTLEEVSKRIGISTPTLSRYEKEIITNIPSDKIEALAKVLRITPVELMGWEPPQLKALEAQITYEPTALDRFVESISDFSDDEIQELSNYAAFIMSKRKEL